MTSAGNSFYCSQKFTWLSLDLEKKLLYSCCSAYPENIDFQWLKNNPGNLFNSMKLRQERQDMLDNKPVESCRNACWEPESKGLESRRNQFKTYLLTHTDTQTVEPEYLNIILGSTCNLACTYCCKQFSTAWTREIKKHGPYFDDPRFKLVPLDIKLAKTSHNDHRNTEEFDIMVDEISRYKNIKQVMISGGEPFLYNSFPELINHINGAELMFFTGLGVDTNRLVKQLGYIDQKPNITAVVSAESCNRLYEFNRYGNTYDRFLENLKITQDYFPTKFSSVLSNLTIHGLVEFENQFPDQDKFYSYCNDPNYLNINVLDDETKQSLINEISNSDIKIKDSIVSTIEKPCSEHQRQQFSSYLGQLAVRRNLKLDIFPSSMLKWLNLT